MDLTIVRRRLEADEARLNVGAARTAGSRGRARREAPSPYETEYQRDRGRILHTKAFRRLKHKTQVFIAPTQDHYVTRLTHTLEVAHVARTIARALNLNEDLAEAAALGHDIGHGPFGHAGEETLAECLPEGFRHNYHSVRVLEQLENSGRGLNLTHEVLDAIAKSSKAREDILAEGWGVPETLEGQVVKVADAIAYLNHDILDAIRSGLITNRDLPVTSQRLGSTHAERVDAMVRDIVAASWAAAETAGPATDQAIRFGPEMRAVANELREFMFERVYLFDSTRKDAERGKAVVKFLFAYYVGHADEISAGFSLAGDAVERRAADFVSGMTDRYALRIARELGFGPALSWNAGEGLYPA